MSCFADEQFVEILDRGGLRATRPDERAHLETCAACRDSWATVAAAGELLRDARPKTAAARGRLVPVLIAAAMLLAIVGVIVIRRLTPPAVKPIGDPVASFIDGPPEEAARAREMLVRGGRKSLASLVGARPKFKASPRYQSLQDLIFQIKQETAAPDPDNAAIFKKLSEAKLDISFENGRTKDILFFLQDLSQVSLVLDPSLEDVVIDTFQGINTSLRGHLEVLCAVRDLDFDVRYGVVFLSTPLRLWSTDPAVGLPAANQWQSQILAGEDRTVGDKLRSVRITFDMQNAPPSAIVLYLGEVTGVKFKAVPALPEEPASLKIGNLRLYQAVELLTLPYGWDTRIEGGVVLIVPRKK